MISDYKMHGFTRNWNNPDQFPCYEDDEAAVRYDMQYQPNELMNRINLIADHIKADEIPLAPIAGLDAATLQDALAAIWQRIKA